MFARSSFVFGVTHRATRAIERRRSSKMRDDSFEPRGRSLARFLILADATTLEPHKSPDTHTAEGVSCAVPNERQCCRRVTRGLIATRDRQSLSATRKAITSVRNYKAS
jgi:hypothetical protein